MTYRVQEEERKERRRVDWTRVHIEGDRRSPLTFVPRPGRWINIIKRGNDNDERAGRAEG
jgi:hypothetical protein